MWAAPAQRARDDAVRTCAAARQAFHSSFVSSFTRPAPNPCSRRVRGTTRKATGRDLARVEPKPRSCRIASPTSLTDFNTAACSSRWQSRGGKLVERIHSSRCSKWLTACFSNASIAEMALASVQLTSSSASEENASCTSSMGVKPSEPSSGQTILVSPAGAGVFVFASGTTLGTALRISSRMIAIRHGRE